MTGYKKTGVKCTEEEAGTLREHWAQALKVPVMIISGDGIDMATRARHNVSKEIHALALTYGLPEIPGFYGIDQDNEFVEAVEGEQDK